jgi:hypothetical protein
MSRPIAGRPNRVLLLGDEHRGTAPADSDVRDSHDAAVVRARTTDMAGLECREGDRLYSAKGALADLACIGVESRGKVDGDHRGLGRHPGLDFRR